MTGLGALAEMGARRLAEAGIEQPRREARLLLAAAAGIEAATILAWPERATAQAGIDRFEAYLARRASYEPLSRILGRREFWSLDLLVTPAVLDPRPDTETLVEAVLASVADRRAPLRILDFGTGSGCILLALLQELPGAEGFGIDRSPDAAGVARRNAERLGLADRARFLVSDWDRGITGLYDVVVSNPPYIPSDDIADLSPSVARYDPRVALDGGPDGLRPYRVLAPAALGLLKPGGITAFECGAGQAQMIGDLIVAAGFTPPSYRQDLAGITRVIVARRPGDTK